MIIGRVYKYLNEEMKCLWSKDLKLNTVHVRDVARASWHLTQWYFDQQKEGETVIFNLADKQDTGNTLFNNQICNIKMREQIKE